MLPHKNRIPRADFPSYKVKGFRVFSPLFSAVFYKKEVGEPRTSVVVSKKIAKHAVDRNTLRRRIYDTVRPFLNNMESCIDVIFYPKIEAKTASSLDLVNEVEKAFKQIKR